MTLKQYLEKNKIKLSQKQMFYLGRRIADSVYKRNGNVPWGIKVEEDGFMVNDYPKYELAKRPGIILRYLKELQSTRIDK